MGRKAGKQWDGWRGLRSRTQNATPAVSPAQRKCCHASQPASHAAAAAAAHREHCAVWVVQEVVQGGLALRRAGPCQRGKAHAVGLQRVASQAQQPAQGAQDRCMQRAGVKTSAHCPTAAWRRAGKPSEWQPSDASARGRSRGGSSSKFRAAHLPQELNTTAFASGSAARIAASSASNADTCGRRHAGAICLVS